MVVTKTREGRFQVLMHGKSGNYAHVLKNMNQYVSKERLRQ